MIADTLGAALLAVIAVFGFDAARLMALAPPNVTRRCAIPITNSAC